MTHTQHHIRISSRILASVLTLSLLITPFRAPRAFTIFGTGSDGEEIVAAIQAMQAAVTAIIATTNTILRTLEHLQDFSGQGTAINLLNNNLGTLNQITGDLQSIQFTASSVQAQYQQLFPKEQNWKNIRYSDYDNYYASWQNRLNDSTQVALRNQARLADVQQNNNTARSLLDRTQQSAGSGERNVVAQLQAVNQMIGLTSKQMNSVIQSLTETGRVTTEMAAVSAAEKQQLRARKENRADNYTYMGQPATVLPRLP